VISRGALVVVLVTTALLVARPAFAAGGGERRVTLDRVVDGDTLKLGDGTRVRLIGIDTPETVHPDFGDECYGPEATRFAERLLRPADELRLVLDVESHDQYGRLLAYVYRAADGLFVNAQLVKRGYAYVETVPPNVAHAEQFRRLAREAREHDRGLWSACPNDGSGPKALVSTCLPDYVGACVPPPPPDLDCADIGHPIRIVGDDPHRLDRDGDGKACEPSSIPGRVAP
jgi:endonuclease YncB( thermonuclease family)